MANKDYYGGQQQYYPPQGLSYFGECVEFLSQTRLQVDRQDRGATTPGPNSPNNRTEANLTVNHTVDQGTNLNRRRRLFMC